MHHAQRVATPASNLMAAAGGHMHTHQRKRWVNTPAMSSGAMPKDRRSFKYMVAMPADMSDMAAGDGGMEGREDTAC